MTEIDPERSIYGSSGNPLTYPGERPSSPTLLMGTRAITLDWTLHSIGDGDHIGRHADEVLRERGSAALADRVAQVAFGANRDLHNLAWKFQNLSSTSRDLVVLPGWISDADVVACNIGYWGYVYGALILHRPPRLSRPYLSGLRTPVSILLLDEPQMRAMHVSEGVPRTKDPSRREVSCDVSTIDVELEAGGLLSAQLYCLPLPYLSFDGGRPVRFTRVSTIGNTSGVAVMTQEQIWQRLARHVRLRGITQTATGPELYTLIRQGAHPRSRGVVDLGDPGQRAFSVVRKAIINSLHLVDPDGAVRTAVDGQASVRSFDQFWDFSPLFATS